MLAGVLDAAVRVEERDDQLRRTTRDLSARVTTSNDVDGGNFRTFIVDYSKFAVSLRQICHKGKGKSHPRTDHEGPEGE